MKTLTWFFLAVLATASAAETGLTWKQTDNSLALAQDQRVVWQFNYKKEEGKPYFHPVTVGGGSTLTDLRPADHYWHRALWFSWKSINGVNYWEEDPKTGKAQGQTEIVQVQVNARPDHSARFDLALSFHPPAKPPVMTEKCAIEVGAPTPAGAYSIDWISTFTAGGTEVLLDRTPVPGEPKGVSWGGYAGLSLRLAPDLKKWQFADSEGVVKQASKRARWMSFSGPLADGKPAAIVVLDHPTSLRHPTAWYLINNMPYFSPAVLYPGPYTLPAGESFTLKYRIWLQPGAFDRDLAQKQWEQFAGEQKK